MKMFPPSRTIGEADEREKQDNIFCKFDENKIKSSNGFQLNPLSVKTVVAIGNGLFFKSCNYSSRIGKLLLLSSASSRSFSNRHFSNGLAKTITTTVGAD
jgi:hypothetical protein